MIDLEASAERIVDQPPERVFALVADPRRAPEWDPGVLAVEQITPGPVGAGALFRETHRVFARRHTVELEIDSYQAPWLVSYATTAGGPKGGTRYELSAHGRGTRIRAVASARVGGPLLLIAPVLGRVMRRQLPVTLAQVEQTLRDDDTPCGRG